MYRLFVIVFTGIIQGLGHVQTLSPLSHRQATARLQITLLASTARAILTDMALGDSIAVDGVCLTVEEKTEKGFLATASPETLRRTTLGQAIQRGQAVNIESSLRAGGKLGGHFVTGHVDGVGSLRQIQQTGQAWELSFGPAQGLEEQWRQALARYLAPKGSIAVNGISLTIAALDPKGQVFTVAVIPHTYQETNLQFLQPGSWVNLEGDILAKYVERLLTGQAPDPAATVDLAFLAEHGYT
jgi:riboflavin synthase